MQYPWRPISIGFVLLALPLIISIFISVDPAARWMNALAAAVMVAFSAMLFKRGEC